ncbi:MAG: hypothetical protein Q8P56_02930, partial [Candidatus Uhrbacteria bacterium]|nr:hypothetical protein [Candidatus Uhrbacteria bacterium]
GGLLLGIVYLLFISPVCTIEFVNVKAPEGIDPTAVRSVVFDQMHAPRYRFFSQKNIFLLSERELEANLKNQFLVDSFTLKRKPPHTVEIVFSGKPFRMLWVSGQSVYDVSSEGILARVVDPLSPIASAALSRRDGPSRMNDKKKVKERTDIPIVVYDGSEPAVVGVSVISPEMLVFVLDAWRLFDQSGIHPAYSTLEKNNPTIRFVTTEGWSVLLSAIGDPGAQLNHVRQVLDRSFKTKRVGLQYIDARFENRVYYK